MNKEERFEVFYNDELGKWVIKDNEQMPHLLDNYKSCVRLNEFAEKVDKLQSQLAEKEKKIESCNHTIYMNMLNQEMLQLKVANLEQSQNQTAIAELEKVKEFLLEKIAEKQSDFDSGNYNDFADGVKTICEIMLILIDNQIKSLKGEK